MTTRLRWLALAGFIALLAAGAAACGETTTTTTHNLCHNVKCDEGLACDLADGQCKCGGAGGLICKPGEICNAESGVCYSPKCEFQACDKGQTCDPLDGVCKCGDTQCQEGETCVDLTCVAGDLCKDAQCGPGLVCDPEDGICKCAGVACDPGQSCMDGECVEDLCAGVNCTLNAICSRLDGACHCMGSTGPICGTGEACVAETMTCEGTDLCAGVICGGGTACDPADGKCHCDGTMLSNSPICDPGQTCIDGRCVGGELCRDVQCPADFQCDPRTGLCRCGDANDGPVCEAGQTCTNIRNEWTCTQPCTLLGAPNGCENGEACVLDVSLASKQAFCAEVGVAEDGDECVQAYDCKENLVCLDSGTTKVCRTLCTENDECAPFGSNFMCFKHPDLMPEGYGWCLDPLRP
ncbi:MAG TPA: hypothetical protein VN033_09910 [Vulgatibacter sp.]|nr:hypothetical protein [Vulgatibacter sp.]